MVSANAEIGFCDEYCKPGEESQRTTVVIAPIHMKEEGENTTIAWACSKGQYCTADCQYARREEGRSFPEMEEDP